MVSFIEGIILGIIQGIAEWLPISSSGHLALAQYFFGVKQPIIFDVLLHVGSLCVVIVVFWKDIVKLIRGVLRWDRFYVRYALWIVVATIPIGLVGVFLNDFVKASFTSMTIIGWSFLFTATLLFLSKYPEKKEEKLGWKSVLIMGCIQAFAIMPGVSRSGSTISAGLMQGVKRRDAARLSFLLFIPAIVGATVFEIGNVGKIDSFGVIAAGMITTFVVGYISLKLLLRVIEKGKFSYFGWYMVAVGVITLLL